MNPLRFTRDGSEALESLIAQTCEEIGREVTRIIPADKFQALLLGGGYGRGEGGVLATPTGDAPYNDLEFFLLIQGHPEQRRLHDQLRNQLLLVLAGMSQQVGVVQASQARRLNTTVQENNQIFRVMLREVDP